MGFEIEKLDLEGMLLIHAHVANDNRGFYRKEIFLLKMGWTFL